MLSRSLGGRVVTAVCATVMVTLCGSGVATARAADGDIGYEDASYAPLGGSPTAKDSESKLWFNRGWWGVLWSPAAGEYRLARLDQATHTWSMTPAAADKRRTGRADTLWVPSTGKLYVASHRFVNAGHRTAPAPRGDGARLYRYSYNPGNDRYTLDPGYPVKVNDVQTETLVIDRDSSGTLWATWTYDSHPYVAHTIGGDDARWSEPYVVPGAGSLDPDDTASLVAFGGRIGVMWSDQRTKHFSFAVHGDRRADGDADWDVEQVPLDATADDHISLKADRGGTVYAAVKTSESGAVRPLIVLLVRAPDGSWSHSVFGRDSDSHTRPIVVLDEQHRMVHVYATGPHPPATSGQAGGEIVEKTTAMDNPSFLAGVGTPIIRNRGSRKLNDATSTKQSVDGASGIVVLANDTAEDTYWHAAESLGGGGVTPAVTAAFTATPRSGRAPLKVTFTDTSGGDPTNWSWSFGDGSTSTTQSPVHVYSRAGTYDVRLTAANEGGGNSVTKTGAITVTAPDTGGVAAGGQVARVGKVRTRLRRPAIKVRGRRLTIIGNVVHGRRARLTVVFTTKVDGRRITRRRTTRVRAAGRYRLTLRLPRAARAFTRARLRLRYAGTPRVTAATRRIVVRRRR